MTREELELEIDYLYCCLENISKRLDDRPKSGIELMIDRATGFQEAKDKKNRREALIIIRMIIRRKKKLGANTSDDEKFLAELKKLKI